jgi:hypothetical protein
MPIRKLFACTLLALTCGGGLSALPSYAADNSGSRPSAMWQPVFDFNDEDTETRDLRPGPGRPAGRPRVTLRPSTPVVRVGMPINFELGSTINGFAHIYVVSASGRVQVWMENAPIAAGNSSVFPNRGTITAAPPTGREDIILIVTRERINGFLGYGSTRVPRDLDYDPVSFKQAVKDKFEDLPRRDWGYDRKQVQVVNRGGPDGGVWDWDSGEWQ